MGKRLWLAAASDWRALLVLGAGVVAAAVLSNPFPALIGLGLYLWVVQKLVGSPGYQGVAEAQRTGEALAERYRALQQAEQRLLHEYPGLKQPLAVATAARQIYQEWLSRPKELADRVPVVEDALQLGTLFLRILRAYYALYDANRPAELAGLRARIERNRERLAATQDLEARQTLQEAIELDERALARETAEEVERERYAAKLSGIESSLDLLRRQMLEPEAGAESSKVHDLLLEAEAMDQALSEVQSRAGGRVRAR